MFSREWKIDSPRRHVVHLDYELPSRETRISVDGEMIHFDKAPFGLLDQGFTHTFLIDGVSYTVRTGKSELWEFFPTNDAPPTRQRLALDQRIFRAIILLIFGPVLFQFAYDEFARAALMLIEEPFVLLGLTFAGYVVGSSIMWQWISHREAPHRVTSRTETDVPIQSQGGVQPRRGLFFRPWLEDIRRTAVSGKHGRRGRRRKSGLDNRAHNR